MLEVCPIENNPIIYFFFGVFLLSQRGQVALSDRAGDSKSNQ